MTRLIDRLIAERPEPAIYAALKSTTVIVADNVAEYMAGLGHWSVETVTKLPNVAPPLKTMFVEFRLPRPFGAVGWYLQAFDRTELDFFPSQHIREQDVEGARWMIRGMMYLERFPKRPQMWAELFVNADGSLCLMGSGDPQVPFYVRPTVDSIYAPEWEHDPFGNWMVGIVTTLLVVMWTLCFMHTKNVSLDDVAPPPKLNRAHQKRHREPLSVYKVLRITPIGAQASEGAGAGGGSHAEMSLHIRRGHFAHFSQDTGLLFGKWEGIYWWQQQLIGRRSKGTVRKDYDVRPMREEQSP